MNINKVMLFGNLTRDPEIRQLPSGMNVANIGLATNRYYNNKEGQRVEEVEYHNVVFSDDLPTLHSNTWVAVRVFLLKVGCAPAIGMIRRVDRSATALKLSANRCNSDLVGTEKRLRDNQLLLQLRVKRRKHQIIRKQLLIRMIFRFKI